MKKVLAICGSTRKISTNLQLIEIIKATYADRIELTLSGSIEKLPQFNPDNLANTPGEVVAFKKQIAEADGVLISTPEYAMGVPGALKNVIDWTVASCEFSKKPVALITASTSGQKAHLALLNTLKVIEANISELLIQYIQTKVREGALTDEPTQQQVDRLMSSFIDNMVTNDNQTHTSATIA